jgi:prepilin-type N-terminal cleavage/methylation domain-containing protein
MIHNIASKATDSGMTLIEMIIAIFIFSLILVGSTLVVGKTFEYHRYSMEEGVSVSDAHVGLKTMIEEIRGAKFAANGAYSIDSADKNSLTIYSDMDNDGTIERVHYYLDQGTQTVKKGIREPSGTPPVYESGDQTTETIATYVVNTTSQPLFRYYNINYPSDQVNNPLSTPAAINLVRMAKIEIYINIDPYHSPDNVKLESFVEFRNLKDNW